jgi:hypothetical protein
MTETEGTNERKDERGIDQDYWDSLI